MVGSNRIWYYLSNDQNITRKRFWTLAFMDESCVLAKIYHFRWHGPILLNYIFICFIHKKILKSNSFTQDGNLGLDIAMKFYWNLLSVCCRKFCGGSLTPGITTTLIKQAWWEYYNNTSLWLLMMFYLSFSHLEVLAAWSIGGLYLHITHQDHVTKDSSCQILIPWV